MPRTATIASRIVLTADLARASGQDAANAQMRKANRKRWSRGDYDLACVTTARLMLYVPFAHGGLDGVSLPISHYEDMGLTLAEVVASGNSPAGHNGGPSLSLAA